MTIDMSYKSKHCFCWSRITPEDNFRITNIIKMISCWQRTMGCWLTSQKMVFLFRIVYPTVFHFMTFNLTVWSGCLTLSSLSQYYLFSGIKETDDIKESYEKLTILWFFLAFTDVFLIFLSSLDWQLNPSLQSLPMTNLLHFFSER